MGRIRTKLIKRVGNELIRDNPQTFQKTFEENKKLVEEHATFQSKKLRNIVAGYVTQLVNARR